jgi:hypothetical protein
LKSVIEIAITISAAAPMRGLKRNFAEKLRVTTMTTEIIYLAARIHHWLNIRVAQHLAAQAEKLAR